MKFRHQVLAAVTVLASPSLTVLEPGSATKIEPPSSLGFIIQLEPNASIEDQALHVSDVDNPEYLYGLSINAENDTDLNSLLALPQVKQVWPNRYYDRPVPVVSGRHRKTSNATVPVGVQPVHLRDVAQVANINGTSDILSSLKMTGADKVHAEGFTGKGVKIGFLDTRVDWRHPSLGAGFGPGLKVAGGYDLVGDDFVGWNDPVPDDDPLTTCLEGGHGTHVAGILAAREPKGVGFGIVGVTPDASLYAYRVLGCTGGVTDDIIMQGMEKAASDGVDLISMSIGETAVWETGSPYAPLLAKIQSQGIGIIIAAGNEGGQGLYVSSAPAQDASAISVGSVSDVVFATVYNAAGSDGSTIEYARVVPLSSSSPSSSSSEIVYNVFYGDDDDQNCVDQAWTDAIASFPDKERVITLMVWEWVPDHSDMEIDQPGYNGDIDVVRLKKAQSDKILAGIAGQGKNFTLTFKDQTVHQIEQPTGNTTLWFSTFGPTMEMSLKPQVSAPGGTILSTWVTSNGWGYAIISGTSMATPHLAGCYALIKQKYPSLSPKEIASRLQSSATPLEQYLGEGILITTAQQGAGLVNILKAITSETVFSPTKFNLRDSATPFRQNFTIENQSSAPKTYAVGHKGAAEVDALPLITTADVNEMFYWGLNFKSLYANISFSADPFTVPAGGRATVEVDIKPPSGIDPALLPTYSGFITVTDGDSEFVLPYLGIPYKRGTLPTIYTGDLENLEVETQPPAGVPVLPLISTADTGARNNDLMVFNVPAKNVPDGQTRPLDNDLVITTFIDHPSDYVRLDAVPVDLASNPAYNFTPSALGHDIGSLINCLVKKEASD
ncbi:Minor extracellular protease vpr [Colletotrichum orbiculare MAFF 240422]|uniref:Minor extracellular protease vpr n=1 Tax=Colletotrichum orbiculare (strain 104-T / ATCC 96160 / CBS 514.97 / LARS 414 / MAFF 240422) TaxID=1213857 RepID=A0A484FPF1_COLOR|nr:Minor extracellular protease vpr [Colletotrichum orbiculare MAFF 240422]